jgi:hypothetical protein
MGNFQNISALTPVADLTGEWSGSGQFKTEMYGISCANTVSINATINQDENQISGDYSFVGTSAKDLNPDPEYGDRCAIWEASGGTFYGTLDGSRVSVTLSDDGLTYTGTYTSGIIKLSVTSEMYTGTITLTATNFSPPPFEQKNTTPKPTPTPIPEPIPEDKSVSNQGTESVDNELEKTLEQLENELEQNDWAEEALDTDKDDIPDNDDSCPTQSETYNNYQDDDGCPDSSAPEIIIPTRIPDNFFKANGCGSQGERGIDVPDFDFAESCNQHDICYARGGDAEDRKICDEQMYESVKSNSVLGKFGATIYYWGVRLGGVSSFNCVSDSCR